MKLTIKPQIMYKMYKCLLSGSIWICTFETVKV